MVPATPPRVWRRGIQLGMTDDTDTAESARAFGRYRVLRGLGEGAMGKVYLAEDPVIGRKVAVKVLQAQRGMSDSEREEAQLRFEREVKAAGSLAHPHLVTIHDVGREQGVSYIAMEYVEGDSLRTVLGRGPRLLSERVIALLQQIASALDFAHGRGIIHRDVKPANVLLTARGDAKIADFGVAKVSSVDLTRTGIILGTPAYMSPEQVTDQNLTPAADQFSLAVMAYQMLAGKRPFGGENATKTLYQIAYHEPPPASQVNQELPARVDAVLKKAMAKKPGDRYPNCGSFVESLAGALRTGAEQAAAGIQSRSDLATRRMEQVFPQSSELSHLEMSLPTLDMGERQPSLTEPAVIDEGEVDFWGPPPARPRAESPASPVPRPLQPPPLEAPAAIPQTREEPSLKLVTPEPIADDRLDLLPIAQEVGTTVDQVVYGVAKKDWRYRVWQVLGAGIALIVALVMWIVWAPVA